MTATLREGKTSKVDNMRNDRSQNNNNNFLNTIDKKNEAGDGTTDDTTEYLHLLDDTIDFRTLFQKLFGCKVNTTLNSEQLGQKDRFL